MTANNSKPGTEDARAAIRRNIETVAKLEEDFSRNRSLVDRIADGIGEFAGSLKFVVIHTVIFGAWIAINLGAIPAVRKFDPFPFMLLGAVVSLEAIFLATFVLIKQNRMSQRADQRAHLDLQINLLAEQEMTLVLQMLQAIANRLGVRLPEERVQALSEPTSVNELADELQKGIEPGP